MNKVQKRRQTMIERYYSGNEQAYIEGMRKQGSKGGKKSPTNFRNMDKEKHKAISSKGGRS